MSSYEKEMVLFYTNLWGSTGQPTFSPVSLETMAEKNNNSALMLFFIHHLKGEEGNVINACKKVLNYVRPETPGSDIFEELPKFGHFKDMSVQTDMKKPMALSFPSMDGKAGGNEKFGGNIEFESYNSDTKLVRVILQGACSGCPSSTFTLKNGIENMLKEILGDRVSKVEAVNG